MQFKTSTLCSSETQKNAHAYFRRAFSLKALKRFPEAADDFESAKKFD